MRRFGIGLMFVLSSAAQQPALRNYGRLPLVFEPNHGQADPKVKFLARAEGGTLFLTEREAVLTSRGAAPVRMRLSGAETTDHSRTGGDAESGNEETIGDGTFITSGSMVQEPAQTSLLP